MRRLLASAVLGSALILGFTGCGTEPPPTGTPSPTSGSTTASEADILAATNAACNQAVSMSSDFAAGFQRDVNQFADPTASAEAPADAKDNFEAQMRGWSATLTSLATGPVSDELRTVLTESTAAIEAATEIGETPLSDEQVAAVVAIPDNFRAVCE